MQFRNRKVRGADCLEEVCYDEHVPLRSMPFGLLRSSYQRLSTGTQSHRKNGEFKIPDVGVALLGLE